MANIIAINEVKEFKEDSVVSNLEVNIRYPSDTEFSQLLENLTSKGVNK
jgi:hypothetical protein